MALRQLHGQFGSYLYDSLVVAANTDIGSPTLIENPSAPYGTPLRDDKLMESNAGDVLNTGLHFASYQHLDLRDFLEDQECMDDIVINVQRQLESPVPQIFVNMGLGPIVETFMIINDYVDTGYSATTNSRGWRALAQGGWHTVGFGPQTGSLGAFNTKVFDGNYKTILYRETRRYSPNNSQLYRSTTDMGSYTGATGTPAGVQNNMWLMAYNLESRTVGGYPNRIIGPFATIVRAWSIYPGNRSDRSVSGGGPNDVKATNYEFAEGRLQLTIPMLQWNIIGNRRKMTDEEIANDYSNKLIVSNQ